MARRSTRRGAGRAGARKRAHGTRRPPAGRDALLRRADIVEFLTEHAARIAAPDVTLLVGEGEELRAKVATLRGERFEAFRREVGEALGCLEDYAAGRCPQIPYHTVALLAAGLFYVHDPVGAVPDFLPKLGAVDDALVMAVATRLAAEGLRRYNTWKSAAS
jgi:uncharacterized membrane protein YkvA (DUF1232 family)